MNKKLAVVAGLALMGVAFWAASYIYDTSRSDKTIAQAKSESSPLVRHYAQSLGPADAKVVLVEFFDPGCETCRLFAPQVKALMEARPGQVRLVLRYAAFHQGADTMVKILEAARKQDRYWQTLQVMYDTQGEWASHHRPQPDKIWQHLAATDLDLQQIRSDMNSPEILEILAQDTADAETLGVRRTPGFFVNGKPLQQFGLRQLTELIDAEIASNYPG